MKLADVAAIHGGGTPSRSELSFFGGDLPWVTPSDLAPIGEVTTLGEVAEGLTHEGLRASSAKLLSPGSVLFSSRASIGKIAVTDRACATNQGFVNLTPDSELIDSWFLAYLLARHRDDLIRLAGKTTFLEIPRGKFKDFEVALPPLPEQRRIVSRIKACMARVEEIESDGAEASREIDAVFPAILNERFAEILAAYPSHALEEVSDIRGGGSLPKGAPNDQGDASVLLVKVGDMNIEGNDRVIGIAREFLPKNEVGRNTIPSGAVVLPKRGGAIATNKKRMLGRPALIDPNLMAIIARPDVLTVEYLYYWSLTLDLASLSNGGVIPQLNRKDLAPLQVPIPPSDQQRQIVESLKRAETYCGQLRTEFDEAQAERAQLRESILRKAFAGEL